jgi:hypothetical protein
MDPTEAREWSRMQLSKLGRSISKSLPELDGEFSVRTKDTIVVRLLCEHAVAAVAYGFDRRLARAWLQREGLTESLTTQELEYLDRDLGNSLPFKLMVEGMWALAWSIQIVPPLEITKPCDPGFVRSLPNLKVAEPSAALRARARVRGSGEILAMCDLYYCLHWVIRDDELNGRQPVCTVPQWIVTERRMALEWLVGFEDSKQIALDT